MGVPYEKTHLFYKKHPTHFTYYILRRRYIIRLRRKRYNYMIINMCIIYTVTKIPHLVILQ